MFSPDLFSVYNELRLVSLEGFQGISVGDFNLKNFLYADDTALIATIDKDVQKLVNQLDTVKKQNGMEINVKKTEVMTLSSWKVLNCNINSKVKILKAIKKF